MSKHHGHSATHGRSGHKVSMKGLASSIKNQSNNLLRSGSRFTSFDQVRQRHFWSSYFFAADANGYVGGGTTFPLFVTPSGQNGQGFPSGTVLTDRETNWKSSNRVPDNQNFEITEIGVSLGVVTKDIAGSGDATSALLSRVNYQFLNNTILSITYLTNSVPLGLCCDFGQASAAHVGTYSPVGPGGTTTNLSNPFDFRSNGFPAPALRRRFKIPILLQHGETFAFSFVIPRTFFIADSNLTGDEMFIARLDFWATESFVEKS